MMSSNTKVEWADVSWNVLTGCTKVSAGCRNCYAERIAKQLHESGNSRYRNGFKLTFHKEELKTPQGWKKQRHVFVNSMSDTFHENVSVGMIKQIFEVMKQESKHIFMVLTKRAERLEEISWMLPWAENIWAGVSVEDQATLSRIDCLRRASGIKTRFVSFEPLLGAVSKFSAKGIDWVIVGGESGPKGRLMKSPWVRDIRDACVAQRVPFFFKQRFENGKKVSLPTLDGHVWDQRPEVTEPRGQISLFG